MGDFEDSPKWTLVNDFTIHEDQNLSDRPFMRTCVPKTLPVDVTSFEVVHHVEWPDRFGDDRPDVYEDRSYIKFNATLKDRITVFDMENGEIGTFRTLTDCTIKPLPPGRIGGKNKATSYDGIRMSGMSSKEVPAAGLMEGEPGAVTYLAEFERAEARTTIEPESLTAALFLDADKLAHLVEVLSHGHRPVTSFKMFILAELFESEVSTTLSEHWMSRDYGLLKRGSSVSSTGARIEMLTISSGNTTPQNAADDWPDAPAGVDAIPDLPPAIVPLGERAALNYQRYTLIILVLILIALLLR